MKTEAEKYIVQHFALTNKYLKRIDGKLSLHGISFTEFLIMHHLHQAPNNTMRRIELAEAIGITASGITRLLAPMEKIKLVKKEINPRDARVSLVKLSKPGHVLFKDAKTSFSEAAESLLENLSEYDLSRLMQVVSQL